VVWESVVARAVLPLTADLIEQGLNLKAAMEEAARGMSRNLDEDFERNWRAELAETERETGNVVRAIAKGTITDAQAAGVMSDLQEKKVRLERNLTKLHEQAEIQRDLLEAIPAIGDDLEQALWRLLEERPTVLNEILKLIFQRQSITVESWGPNSKRQSRVVSYRLTEGFDEAARVSTMQRSRLPWRLLERR
jgi:hypothetical protein